MCVLVAQLCLTLCECMDCSPPGPSVHGILQWVVIPFSRGLPYPGIKARSSVSQADSLPSELSEKPIMSYAPCKRIVVANQRKARM